jgi:oligosaccharide repeat unit polymerase
MFLLVWSTATILYLGGVLAGTFPFPKPLAVGAFLLNIGTFCLGYLTWSLFQNLTPASLDLLPGLGPAPPLTRDRLARALKVTLLVGLGILLMEMYRIAVLASHFNTSWSYLLTHPSTLRLRLVMFIASNVFQTSGMVMVLSLTNSIFSIGFVLLGVFLYTDRTRWKYVYLAAFLFISLVVGLLHLSRYEVTANILYLVLAYCFLHAQESVKSQVSSFKSSYFKLLIPILAVVLLFVAIDLLLRKSAAYGQANRLQGFAFHLYWYIASPLAAFNDFLTTFNGAYEWGQNTFFPVYKWLCRFHLVHEAEIALYGEKVYLPFMANVYTYLRNFYEDFGLLGVVVAPYLLGWATAAVRLRARRHFQFLNLYLVLLMFILFSSYNFFLLSNQNYLQVAFGFLFFRYEFGGSHEASV